MAAPKKKPKIQASDIEVGKKVEAVMIELAKQGKANDDVRYEERSAWAAERSAWAAARSARAEQQAAIALQTIAEARQDLRMLLQDCRALNGEAHSRPNGIEHGAADTEPRHCSHPARVGWPGIEEDAQDSSQ